MGLSLLSLIEVLMLIIAILFIIFSDVKKKTENEQDY